VILRSVASGAAANRSHRIEAQNLVEVSALAGRKRTKGLLASSGNQCEVFKRHGEALSNEDRQEWKGSNYRHGLEPTP